MSTPKPNNARTALVLLSVAVVFFVGIFVSKMLWG